MTTMSTDTTATTDLMPSHYFERLLDLSAADLARLAKTGVIPPAVEGRYSLAKTIAFYVRHLREQAVDPSRALRAELTREQLRSKRMDNDERERTLLPVAEVTALLIAALDTVRGGLLSLPARLAQSCPELPPHVLRAIDADTRALLVTLAATPLPEPLAADLGRLAASTATGGPALDTGAAAPRHNH